MTIKSTLISVIIPVYKVEKHLDKCIESIVKYIQREREKRMSLKEKYKVEGLPKVILKSQIKRIEIEERGISD